MSKTPIMYVNDDDDADGENDNDDVDEDYFYHYYYQYQHDYYHRSLPDNIYVLYSTNALLHFNLLRLWL